ncbi:flavin reductase family protein [Paenarthrobacter sp. NPDC089322]|uniref:flavin reductase family protein n=1 Tax=Paenarthrobacter sp. NPDC089322 TaxID=3155065 RepID=UPI0034494DF3
MDSTVDISPSVHYFGTPVMLLSTLMPDGETTNVTPVSSGWAIDGTYVLGLGREGQALRNLELCAELVINLPTATLVGAIERIAPTTGSIVVPESKSGEYRYEPDKWSLGGFDPVPSDCVAPDRIAQCPVQVEARVTNLTPLDDTDAVRIVHARILKTHAAESIVVPGTSHIDVDRWNPLYYTFRHYFAQGPRVGANFRAETQSKHHRVAG